MPTKTWYTIRTTFNYGGEIPMADHSFSERFESFQPSKTLWFWSCAACIVGTIIIGFAGFGWTLGGTAESMAQKSAHDARTQLAAQLCVNRFVASPDAQASFTKLQEASYYKRSDVIKEGGWSAFEGIEADLSDVAGECASKIRAM